MLATYLDDIPQIINRMLGRGKTSAKTPRGYNAYFDEAGALKSGVLPRMAQREIAAGTGLASGAFAGRPMKGLSQAAGHLKGSFGKFGLASALIIGTVGAYMAPRGHKMSTMARGIGGVVAFGVGDAIGTFAGGPIAGWVVGSLAEPLGAKLGDAVQMFNDFSKNIKHINMGGNYEDTRIAYTMRQRAAQEMGSSVMNARAWLGKESILLHQ